MFPTIKAELMEDIYPDEDSSQLSFIADIQSWMLEETCSSHGQLNTSTLFPLHKKSLSFKYVYTFAGWHTAVATYIRNDRKTSGLLENSRD